MRSVIVAVISIYFYFTEKSDERTKIVGIQGAKCYFVVSILVQGKEG